jgi:hypothetical protein
MNQWLFPYPFRFAGAVPTLGLGLNLLNGYRTGPIKTEMDVIPDQDFLRINFGFE